MTVLLHRSDDLPAAGWESWCAVTGTDVSGLDVRRRAEGLSSALEAALMAERPGWFALAKELGREPSAILAHMPSCTSNASDFGLMLAWSRLAAGWAALETPILVLCDDPWLFRHLAGLPGVSAGRPPPLAGIEWKLRLRGVAARLRWSMGFALAALRLRGLRRNSRAGAPALLVYGHPASTANGFDAYFGELMGQKGLGRILHVDCSAQRALALAADGRTAPLHAWGSPWTALSLAVRCWKPKAAGRWPWLVRRAAALEGGTAQAAAIAWQSHCQTRWLEAVRPGIVAWPWENHGWERDLVRQGRRLGIATLGYQHAVIGVHEWNHAAGSLPDGLSAIPDTLACAGSAALDRLGQWGIPADRLWLGGAWRYPAITSLPHDPEAPVFLALPAHRNLAAEMVAAARRLAESGRRFLVREHPMTPVGFVEDAHLRRAPGPLSACGPLSAVVFAATTVGLEAAAAGLPVVRFISDSMVANNLVPDGLDIAAADAAGLAAALDTARPVTVSSGLIFAPVDEEGWLRRLGL